MKTASICSSTYAYSKLEIIDNCELIQISKQNLIVFEFMDSTSHVFSIHEYEYYRAIVIYRDGYTNLLGIWQVLNFE